MAPLLKITAMPALLSLTVETLNSKYLLSSFSFQHYYTTIMQLFDAMHSIVKC